MVNLTPFTISGTVYDTDGTTTLSNVRVRFRNERTGDTGHNDTNSDGDYALGLGGTNYEKGDTVTVFVIYTNFEKNTSFVVTEGGIEINLTLATVPESDSLSYVTVQDFYDYFRFDNSSTDVPTTSQIVKIIAGVEADIEVITSSKFDDNDGSYYSVSNEYHTVRENQKVFFTDKIPIVSVSAVGINNASDDTTESFEALSSTAYEIKEDIGMIRVLSDADIPEPGKRQIRFSYTYGRSSIPNDIKQLVMLMAARIMARTRVFGALITGRTDLNIGVSLNALDMQINGILSRYSRGDISKV